jgi:hypothetical protein
LFAFGYKADIARDLLFVRFRGKADVHDRVVSTYSAAIDPNVWSGRALQENFFELADVRSCINVSGL